MRLVTTLCLLALGATACGGNGTGAGGVGDPPVGAWELTSADPPIDVPEGARVTLTIEEVDGRLQAGGTAACNSYGGVLQLDGTTWSLEQVAVTEMACDQPRMAAESAYLDALAQVGTWQVDGDVLRLTGGDVRLTLVRLPPVETTALVGTTWVLDGLVSGTGDSAAVSSVAAGVAPAELRLDDDGTFELFTGCRDFAGDWTTSGDEVTFPSWGQTDDSRGIGADGELTCDAAAEEQEQHVLEVLEGGFTATVDGRRLAVQQGAVGLTFSAATG